MTSATIAMTAATTSIDQIRNSASTAASLRLLFIPVRATSPTAVKPITASIGMTSSTRAAARNARCGVGLVVGTAYLVRFEMRMALPILGCAL